MGVAIQEPQGAPTIPGSLPPGSAKPEEPAL
jgi:hypothetical protein